MCNPQTQKTRREQQRTDTPNKTRHVQMQWWKRNPDRNVDIKTAWRRGVPIGLPNYDCDSARLYAPKSIAILERDGVMTTVLHSDPIEINDDHLHICSHCGLRFEKEDSEEAEEDACHWCNEPHADIQEAARNPLTESPQSGTFVTVSD